MRIALLVGLLAALTLGTEAHAAAPVVRASVAPRAPQLGDPVRYTVTVSVPRAQAGTVTVDTDVGVLTRIDAPHTVRTDDGDVTRITVTERLACLDSVCVSKLGGRLVTIPAPRVRVGGAPVPTTATRLPIQPRVPLSVVRANEPGFVRPSDPPVTTSRVDPRALEWGLVVAGCLLLLAGIFGLLPLARRREDKVAAGRPDALQRAIRLLRESVERGTRDRRRAASHAGRVVGEPALASDAARLAWSRPDPVPPDVAALADRVELAAEERG